jgi:hypothetical protein
MAEEAARNARLPGWDGGPADAFRHIAASAEMARQYGENLARALGRANELKGAVFGQKADDEEMDIRNNEIGIRIGGTASNFEEILERTRAAGDEAVRNGPGNSPDAPTWHPPERWREDETKRDRSNWPPVWTEGNDGDADRVLARPVAEWTQEDVRTVQNARVYLRGDGPARDIAFDKVRQWYETRSGAAPETGGPVTVRAYVRGDGARVAGHSRASPQRDGVRR